MDTEQRTDRRDVYAIVTDRVIEILEKGVIPWRISWARPGIPMNLINKRPYRGLNTWLLTSFGFKNNCFLTLKQLNEIGGKVKKEEKACPVIYWKKEDVKDDDTGEISTKTLLRYYSVFNIEQCEGIPQEMIPVMEYDTSTFIFECEAVIEEMPNKPKIRHLDPMPYYHPGLDIVNVPSIKKFQDSESYYSTLFHELVHSTGHASRLARKELMMMTPFGSEEYSYEELVAELGATYLNFHTGIGEKLLPNDVAYIAGWLKRLKSNKRLIVLASAQAQKAVDFILDIKFEQKTNIEEAAEVTDN